MRDDTPRRCRVLKRNRKRSGEAVARAFTRRAKACSGMSRNLRGWAEHSPAGIAKIEACTCPARKGRTFYASSRSSYSSTPFSSLPFRPRFARLLFAVLSVPFHPRTSLRAFLPLGFVSVIRSSSFSLRPFRHAFLSLFLSLFFVFFWTELWEFFSPSCITLLSALLSIFFPLHAVWLCTP